MMDKDCVLEVYFCFFFISLSLALFSLFYFIFISFGKEKKEKEACLICTNPNVPKLMLPFMVVVTMTL